MYINTCTISAYKIHNLLVFKKKMTVLPQKSRLTMSLLLTGNIAKKTA